MKYAPPKPEICGNWIIDSDRTNWAEATQLLQRERQDGCLVIRSDGTFSFKEMPDFSDFMCAPTFNHSGTGKWWTDTNTEGIAYLCLSIGETVGQRTGIAYFFRADGTYFLYFIIIDPDTSEVLVLKKVEKK